MKEVTVQNFVYRIGMMDARKQFHVARRLAPLLASLTEVFNKPDTAVTGLLAIEISKMKDEDVDYVIDNCLAVCERKQEVGGTVGYAPVRAPNSTRLMFADIDASALMELTAAVVEENLKGFFPTAQPASPAKSG
jgi:hypothetical protein